MNARLSILYFLQFAVWGSYLTSFGQFLGSGGLGMDIAWFYAAVGLVSIVTPALFGHLADRAFPAVRLLALCHFLAACAIIGAWLYAERHPMLQFGEFFPIYLIFLAFYLPTMALSNTATFAIVKSRGFAPAETFPSIRVWGTMGFVAAMWMVNSTYFHNGTLGWTLSESHPMAAFRFQYTSMQLLCAGAFGLLTALYALTLPAPIEYNSRTIHNHYIRANLRDVSYFFVSPQSAKHSGRRISPIGIFLIFAAFTGVCMQISNGFATPFISHFIGEPQYFSSFAAGNATMLFSLSQISEAFCILLVGRSLKKFGIGVVFGAGIFAWVLRFLFFGIGNPGEGVIFLILSMIVYGIAFNFITIAAHLFIEQVSSHKNKGLGQGLLMLMSNGVGATVGTICAGAIINRWCQWQTVTTSAGSQMRLFIGEWQMPWLIFAGYAAVVLAAWLALRPVRASRIEPLQA